MSLSDNEWFAKSFSNRLNEKKGFIHPICRRIDIKESISRLKDNIISNDIYTADEIFRLINEEFGDKLVPVSEDSRNAN